MIHICFKINGYDVSVREMVGGREEKVNVGESLSGERVRSKWGGIEWG